MSEADTKTREKLSVVPKGHWRNRFIPASESARTPTAKGVTMNADGSCFGQYRHSTYGAALNASIVPIGAVCGDGWIYVGPVFFPDP